MKKDKRPGAAELGEAELAQAVGGAPQPGKKRLATILLEPLESGLAPDGGAALDDWIKDSWDYGLVQKNIELMD